MSAKHCLHLSQKPPRYLPWPKVVPVAPVAGVLATPQLKASSPPGPWAGVKGLPAGGEAGVNGLGAGPGLVLGIGVNGVEVAGPGGGGGGMGAGGASGNWPRMIGAGVLSAKRVNSGGGAVGWGDGSSMESPAAHGPSGHASSP